MSFSKEEKTAIEGQDDSFTKYDKAHAHDSSDNITEKAAIDSDDDQSLTSQEAGDAALANSPWQYKLIALVTALLFPRKI